MRRATVARYRRSVQAIQDMAAELGHTPSQMEYERLRTPGETISRYAIHQTHDGWAAFLAAAGLEPHRRSGTPPRKAPDLCECGQPVAGKVKVRCGSGYVTLYLCEEHYLMEVS